MGLSRRHKMYINTTIDRQIESFHTPMAAKILPNREGGGPESLKACQAQQAGLDLPKKPGRTACCQRCFYTSSQFSGILLSENEPRA